MDEKKRDSASNLSQALKKVNAIEIYYAKIICMTSGSTRLIKGVKGKKGASFDAAVAFDADFNLKLSFPKPKGGKGK